MEAKKHILSRHNISKRGGIKNMRISLNIDLQKMRRKSKRWDNAEKIE